MTQQFRIEETISESSTTRVYRASQVALGRQVLLKVLRPHLASDTVVRERFVREAHACAKLRSEHIVQVYDLTEYEQCPAIVMEFVIGRSLKELLAEQPAERPALARKTAIHVLRALTVAHRHGVTHRDIKPGNILVTEEGTMKVTDFGLAHIADSTLLTNEGIVLGTPAYMSPEQIRGDRVDARTDLFALGITLVEVLTGERVFEGESYADCVRKISAFEPEMLDRFAGSIPEDLLAFVKRMVQPSPTMRFESSKQALEALQEKGEASSPSVQNNRSQKIYIALGAGAVVILVLVFLLSLFRSHPVIDPGARPATAKTTDTTARIPEIGRQPENASDVHSRTPASKGEQRQQLTAERVRPTNSDRTPDSVSVRISCTPWAKVFLDGRSLGETPFEKAVTLSSGRHTVTLTNPSFDPIVRTFVALGDSEVIISENFMDHAGYLRCVVQPWADIYIDDQYKDTTPLSKPILLAAGKHRLRLHNNSVADSIREITIIPRDTLSLKLVLR